MSNIAIKAENLSKAYQLGEIGTGTISRDLERWYARIRGKEDPFLRIGETNDRTSKGTSDIVWSLKDINFEIEQGDAVGIIGRNGAGKSTLLKVLSRVTSPTAGRITGKGRIASLLEVGTGFHPELTGRENIYLNGAILGMRKKEITRKFDEIVDFAGVERYIDTPVKRYSSGMYVRLAFAVAAHLESEILIVDEVLAVGDAEFQKKCLGKMGEVSKGEGRTVLFVSHNMGSIEQLCNKSIVLSKGTIEYSGDTHKSIEHYIASNNKKLLYKRVGNQSSIINNFHFVNHNGQITNQLSLGQPAELVLDLDLAKSKSSYEIGINFKNQFGELISHLTSQDNQLLINFETKKIIIKINYISFTPGSYLLDIYLLNSNEICDGYEGKYELIVENSTKALRPGGFPSHVKFFTPSEWKCL
ncbi:ABC transporter ATP-binding protein [Nubsella zeaxanthinifaciens]|jgi:lipopolysaccharide transport system ATP-binding protein|uniref:ABC transporter ATP-binding protein n=1 Tax=Nubsella zeaxanthinifaciens TaxID=392412 RepID=UPI00130091F3|nr:ABC transporter ATP-binding protein [Nubsella zeaxanthinifaciens]